MEPTNINKAQEIIKSIRNNQTANSSRLENLDSQVKDLSQAMRSVQEQTAKPIIIEGKDAELKQYINDDGSLQLCKRKKGVNVPGYGMINVEQKGILDTEKNHSEWHAELKQIAATQKMAKMLVGHTPKTDAKLANHIQKAPSFLRDVIQKSLYDSAGAGGEWVPDEFRDAMYQEFTTPRTLADNFDTVDVQGNVIVIPRMDFGGRPFLRGQVSSDVITNNVFTASTPQSAQASISMSGIACRYRVDTDLLEDSILQLLPILTKQIGSDLTSSYEDALINGDNRGYAASQDPARNVWNIRSRWGGASFDDTTDHRRLFDGLRRESVLRNTKVSLGNAATTSAKLLELMATCGELGASNGLMFVTSPELFITDLMGLTEVKTLDQFGPLATVLTGQLGSIFGVPIVLSRFVDIQYNAGGGFDNITKNRSALLCVARDSYKNYQKSGIAIETAKEISSGSMEIVATMRKTFASADQSTTKNVAYGFDTQNF